MKIIAAEFVTSAAAGGSTDGIPRDGLPQLAMAGRSNVGKSTLLNALCRRAIARTSAAPGKTRLANVYRVTVGGGGPGTWSVYLVDLPGYGYARGGADAAAELKAVAEAYFLGVRRSEVGAYPHWDGARDASGRTESNRSGAQRSAAGAQWDRGGGRDLAREDPAAPGIDRGAPKAAHRNALLLVDARHPGMESDIRAAGWLASMQVEYRVVATKIDKLSRSERARNLKALELTSGMPPLAVSATSGEGLDALWKTIASLARTGRA